jgi:hypothetical protein
MGALLGTGVASAQSSEPAIEAVSEVEAEAPPRFSAEWVLAGCERYLPACQPAIAQRALEGHFQGLRGLPRLRAIPVMHVDPRVSRVVTSVATGLVLRSARDIASDPLAVDPLRYFSPVQRDMVGIHTPSDQLGELAHPVIGTSGFRPSPRAADDSDSD